MKAYQAIDCDFYDMLEALATMKRVCKIIYTAPSGEEKMVETRILDFFIQDRAEFMKLENESPVRLDWIVSVNDLKPSIYCLL